MPCEHNRRFQRRRPRLGAAFGTRQTCSGGTKQCYGPAKYRRGISTAQGFSRLFPWQREREVKRAFPVYYDPYTGNATNFGHCMEMVGASVSLWQGWLHAGKPRPSTPASHGSRAVRQAALESGRPALPKTFGDLFFRRCRRQNQDPTS